MEEVPKSGGRRRAKRARRKNDDGFFVVGIGASAGGIKALEQFFELMPNDSGMAFIAIIHLSPLHESNLAGMLQRRTSMSVIQVVETVKVEPNHVYVIPPAKHLIISDGSIRLTEPDEVKGRRAPVDLFFRTLAEAHNHHAIGLVLTGTGSDGTLGLKRIKEQGGISIAQDPEEAEHQGMPRSAIESGTVDFILPVGKIPEKLIAIREASEVIQIIPESDRPPRGAEAHSLRELLSFLRVRTGHDFSHYKQSTILRRITRRMQMNALVDLASYLRFIREHPAEVQELLSDLLISVTNFFRDTEAFEVLERDVVPRIFENKGVNDQVRVWVVGCATGEEAYSIAMLLQEPAERLEFPPSIQIFASDIDEDSIHQAREGLFPETISADVSQERLKRFFNKEGLHYRVKKEIREMVLFAPHNVLRDPPFSKLDLVSCRNLLIYLNRETQERVLDLFHFALRPNGFLFLGSSESADNLSDLYSAVDKKLRIFKRSAITHGPPYVPTLPVRGRWDVRIPESPAVAVRKSFSYGELHHLLLEQYAPPSALVNHGYDIVHLSENAGRYLRFSGGEPTRNLIKIVHPDLRLELRSALFTATREGRPSETRNVAVSIDGETRLVNIIVRPVTQPELAQGFLLVIFNQIEPQESQIELSSEPITEAQSVEVDSVTRGLEDELQRTKDQLRATIEQYETSTEELKASNEELQAINEELRSATEELETSREELQSVNEELTTVNHELKDKVAEVSRANSDLQNLLAATEIGTVFLDREMQITGFTPRFGEVFNIIPSDKGRPLAHLTHKLNYDNLPEDAEHVLQTLARIEREVRSTEGRSYIARLLPYRTIEDKIDGVVLTFIDITKRKQIEEELERQNAKMQEQAQLLDLATVLVRDLNNRIIFWSGGMERMYGWTKAEALGKISHELLQTQFPQPWEEFRGKLFQSGSWEGELVRTKRDGMKVVVASHWVLHRDEHGRPIAIIEGNTDITERKQAEIELRLSQERLRMIVQSIEDYAIFTLDLSGLIESWNTGAEKIYGYTQNEVIGQSADLILTPEDREGEELQNEMRKVLREEHVEDERWHLRKDGSRFYASGVMAPLRNGDVIGFVKITRDITERKRTEEDLRDSRDELEANVKERTSELEASYETLQTEVTERRAAEERIKELLRRIVEMQESERQRISRDLHDLLGQRLTALRLNLDMFKELSEGQPELIKQVEQTQMIAKRLDSEVDFLAWELRPGAINELGLVAALENFVQEWSRHFRIPLEFHTSSLTNTRLDLEIETNLYRIAQEALNNVIKHAEARSVDVILERRDDDAVLIIEDNGNGFDHSGVANSSRGIGLISMRERASLLGGMLEIESSAGHGTAIFVRIPIPRDTPKRS